MKFIYKKLYIIDYAKLIILIIITIYINLLYFNILRNKILKLFFYPPILKGRWVWGGSYWAICLYRAATLLSTKSYIKREMGMRRQTLSHMLLQGKLLFFYSWKNDGRMLYFTADLLLDLPLQAPENDSSYLLASSGALRAPFLSLGCAINPYTINIEILWI